MNEHLDADDPDIGICDECGTDEGTRKRCIRDVHFGSEPARIAVWLCEACR